MVHLSAHQHEISSQNKRTECSFEPELNIRPNIPLALLRTLWVVSRILASMNQRTLNPSSLVFDRVSEMVVILSPLLPLATLRPSALFTCASQSERATEACETARLLAWIWEEVERGLICCGDIVFPLPSLAKRTSVARSGEDAVPGERDLNILLFLSDIALSSITASSDIQLDIPYNETHHAYQQLAVV